VTAASFTVSKIGGNSFTRLYGWEDPELKTPLQNKDIPFLIGNLSQRVATAALIELMNSGKIKTSDNALLLTNATSNIPNINEKWRRASIQDIIENSYVSRLGFSYPHNRGLDKYKVKDISELNSMHSLTRILQEPVFVKTNNYYSAAEGIITARIIENVEQKSFLESLHQILGIKFKLSNTLNFSKDHIVYIQYPNDPSNRKLRLDAFFSQKFVDGGLGLACSSRELCGFLEKYWLNSENKKNSDQVSSRFYSYIFLSSVVAYQIDDVTQFVLLMNTKPDRENTALENLRDDLYRVVNSSKEELIR
ncbi:MAG: hypothetical protein AAF984_06345, partial [Verrucomicrobiota bacterium]